MQTGNQVLLLFLIVIIVATIGYQIYRGRVAEPRRSRAIQERISQEGWLLAASAPTSFIQAFAHFPFFAASTPKEVRNVIQGEVDGYPFHAFDYRFHKKIHGANRNTDQSETIVLVESTGLNLPPFALVKPKALEPRISQYQLFDSPGLYRLEGLNEEAVRGVITDAVISNAPTFNVQGQGDELLFYRTWQRSKPADLIDEIRGCVQFAQILAGRPVSGAEREGRHRQIVV